MPDFDFSRYLDAKRTVDDRSLSPRLIETLKLSLGPKAHILELGAGTGAGSHRLWGQGVAPQGTWCLMDQDSGLLEIAIARLTGNFQKSGGRIDAHQGVLGINAPPSGSWDLIFAQAVLDLFPLGEILDWILKLGHSHTLFYFSLNFDALTHWEPELDRDLDDRIALAYHRSMDERFIGGKRSGDSRCGRHLFTALPTAGFEIVDACASDWAIWPKNGAYHNQEEYFLNCMLHFHETSIATRQEVSPQELSWWLSQRREHVHRGKAVLLVHQWDFIAKHSPR